jgi:hypothetical protein
VKAEVVFCWYLHSLGLELGVPGHGLKALARNNCRVTR